MCAVADCVELVLDSMESGEEGEDRTAGVHAQEALALPGQGTHGKVLSGSQGSQDRAYAPLGGPKGGHRVLCSESELSIPQQA